MKYQPENVADKLFAEIQEKQYRARAWDRKKHWAKDSTYSIWERIGIIAGCMIFAIAVICGVILNADTIDKFPSWFNSLTWVENLFWELPVLALGLWWVIKRSGK